jgi:hypothetical protein
MLCANKAKVNFTPHYSIVLVNEQKQTFTGERKLLPRRRLPLPFGFNAPAELSLGFRI